MNRTKQPHTSHRPVLDLELVAVRFDGWGRQGHQAHAADVLHQAGLLQALTRHNVVEAERMPPGAADPGRGRQTGLINEAALLAMIDAVGSRVARAVAADRFPIVYGGDCTTLLGTVPALREQGPLGLLFVDGHEDTMPLDVSEDGEAANTEIGLLLGLTGRSMRSLLAEQLPALERSDLAMLGQRDVEWRQQFNVGSLRDSGVWLRDWQEIAAQPEGEAKSAADRLRQGPGRWWLHVDLDVLDPREFPAQRRA